MIKFLLNLTGFLVVLIASATAQSKPQANGQPLTFKYGKLNLSDFDIKPSGEDSSANAVVLFDVGSSEFAMNTSGGFALSFERHKRIKILKKEGYSYADFSIPFYRSPGSGEEKINGLTATAYNVENGKIVATKMTSDARFNEKITKNWSRVKFTVPQVKEGTIIEYRYKIISDFLFNLREWNFQSELPTLYTDYSVTIPEYFSYKPIYNISEEIITQLPSEANRRSFSGSANSGTGASEMFSFIANCNKNRWIGTAVPGFKEEAYTATSDDHLQRIEFELMSIKYPNSTLQNFTSTWNKVVEGLEKDESFGQFIKVSNSTSSLVNPVIAGATTSHEKMVRIFNHVKKQVKWDDLNRMYADAKNPKSVLELKKGNSADINLTLISLLKAAKLNCSPVLISTRNNGRHPGYPVLSKFNYVVAAVKIDTTQYLLDASNQYNAINILPLQCLNHNGLLLDMEAVDAKWISLERPLPSVKSIVYHLSLNDNGSLSGKIIIKRHDVLAKMIREEFEQAGSEENYLKDFKKDKNGLTIKSHQFTNMDNPEEVLIEEYEVYLEEALDEVGPNLFLTPTFFEKTSSNPFKLENRKYPVDFAFPTSENYRLILTLPDNVSIDKLPKGLTVKLPDNSAFFEYRVNAEDKTISVQSKISVQRSLYEPAEYQDIKELFKNIVTKQSEQIVLKKS